MSGRHASDVTEPVFVVTEGSGERDDTVEAGIAVLGGMPDADEVAAITAVLAGVLDELAAEQGRRELLGPTAWERSQRALRTPLTPGDGQWRGFSA